MKREEWLEQRRRTIGASEVAAVLGASPFAGPLDVYLSKVHGDDFHGNRATRRGSAMEPVIAEWYAEETGREIRNLGEFEIQTNPAYPFLSATLDRLIIDSERGNAPLEIKSIGGFKSRDEWEVDPPLHYQIQLQMQMGIAGAKWGVLCGGFMASDDIVHHDVQFNQDFFDSALPVLAEFWERVERRDPPSPGESGSALDSVKRAFQGVTTDKTVALPEDAIELVKKWKECGDKEKEFEKQRKAIEAKIRYMMRDAEFAVLPSGQFLSLKTSTRKGYTVAEATFRTLRMCKGEKA